MNNKMKQAKPYFIRNFSIIAHISHGKSTLADRFLELTGRVCKEKMKPQYLDSMDLEREKGITIKMHPVRLIYEPNNLSIENCKIENSLLNRAELGTPRRVAIENCLPAEASAQAGKLKISSSKYVLNLIDTPGHIDFSYEISRALACVEGAILLVDGTRGIQAQTIFNLELAKKQGLSIIGAVNKIDLPQAQTVQTQKELANILGVEEQEIFDISAKNGTNVKELLEAVISKVPPPKQDQLGDNLRALIFDSKYDLFSGVLAYVRVFEGEAKKGDRIHLLATDSQTEIREVGYFGPELEPSPALKTGEIGYIKTGIKIPAKVKVGDTITKLKIIKPEALPGYQEPQPVLFLSLYPHDANDFENLKEALSKLKLNDPALDFRSESKMALGRGFRIGFLGSLHAEITVRRLKTEFNLDLIATSPQVIFKILPRTSSLSRDGRVRKESEKEIIVSSPSDWLENSQTREIKEPWVILEILTSNLYFNQLFKILKNFKAALKETKFVTKEKSLLVAEAPLRKIISGNFYDALKSATEGYASFGFWQIGYRKADLVKLDILIAGTKEDAFSQVVSKEEAFSEGKKILQKLKETLPPQQFTVSLQAAIDGRIIARETMRALRKDVTAPLYGGDVTRKRKLLEIQKKGKKKLKARGKINISPQAFLEMLKL